MIQQRTVKGKIGRPYRRRERKTILQRGTGWTLSNQSSKEDPLDNSDRKNTRILEYNNKDRNGVYFTRIKKKKKDPIKHSER
ncbi:MAG: hypothetical protein AB2705_18485 [Candidatus Thiodiazotropha sp.]